MILKKNKKATDKILSVYWFVILVIVAGAVVAMVSSFYNYPYDVRAIESDLLMNKAFKCISDNGKLAKNLFNEQNEFVKDFLILDECQINFDSEFDSSEKRGEYYLKINIIDALSKEKIFNLSKGNINFEADCNIPEESGEYNKLVFCNDKSAYLLSPFSKDKIYEVNVLVAIAKTMKNVK